MTAFHMKLHMVAIASIFGLAIAFSFPLETEDCNISQLMPIGTIEGKSYFAEGSTTKTWLEGKTFCAACGLQLATVTSVAQATLLKNASSSTFEGCHWTSGRGMLKPSQFHWDSSDVILNSTVVTPFSAEHGLESCICFQPYDKTFYSVSCTREFLTLCELNDLKSSGQSLIENS